MIFLLLSLFIANGFDLSTESLYKFPVKNFDFKTAVGEWVVLPTIEPRALVQVSLTDGGNDNYIFLKDMPKSLSSTVITKGGTYELSDAGIIVVTNKRKIFCSHNATLHLTTVKDSMGTAYKNIRDIDIRTNIKIKSTVKTVGKVISCQIYKYQFDIKMLEDESLENIGFYTYDDTIASFLN